MNNPLLLVKNAGHGVTPDCSVAKFARGAIVRWPRFARDFEAIVAVAVPPGFPAEYALADLLGEARPLMITRPSRAVMYILVREDDPKPYLAREGDLRPTGKRPVEIGSVRREGAE